MAAEINKDISKLVDDLKRGMDLLFDVIEETNSLEEGTLLQDAIIRRKKIQQARDIYHEYFLTR